MVVSDWILIVSIIVLASAAFLAPYVIERWKYRFYAPKLDFDFKFESPYCHLTTMRMRKTQVSSPVYYFLFSVCNSGKRQADDCEAVLERVWEEDSAGNLHEWKNFLAVNFIWAFGDPPKGILKTIYPGRRLFCNIGHINQPKYEAESAYRGISEEEKQKNKFFFEVLERPHLQWDCLIPGKYQIEISVYSKNAQKITTRFKISWSGEWKDTEEGMFKQVVVSLI